MKAIRNYALLLIVAASLLSSCELATPSLQELENTTVYTFEGGDGDDERDKKPGN